MSKKQMTLEIVNPNSAGIDIGSRSHWVAIGQNAEDVREFGVYSEDAINLCKWLNENHITSVAMESTGTYWQNLFSALVVNGFEVILVNGKYTKNKSGKKTDIKDCQWIQKLHAMGLLSSSFLPDSTTDIIRTYSRHRQNLIYQSADTTRKIQKYLRLMNLRLDVVVNDIMGETGTKIIDAIVGGELDGKVLSQNRHYNCRKPIEEIEKALQFNGRTDYMFALKQEWKTYLHLHKQISETDQEIKKLLKNIINKDDNKKQFVAPKKPYKRINKNAIKNMDMNKIAYQYFEGVDLMAIEGINDATVMSIISEVGLEGLKRFESAKQFSAWLRLAPNNKISGGKVLSHSVPKGSNRLKIALRNAANVIGNLKDTHLANFFKRVAFKRGRASAVSATARKLAVIIWNMVVKGMPYNPPTKYLCLEEKRRLGLAKRIKKQITRFELTNEELGIVT